MKIKTAWIPLFFLVIPVFLCFGPVFGDDAVSNSTSVSELPVDMDDEISKAFQVLKKPGAYEEKKKAIKVFNANYQNDRVAAMAADLLVFSYDNPDFKENDQVVYYDDVIAEQLVRLLGKNGSPKYFSALLRIALFDRFHRDLTIRAAWEAIQAIKW